MRMNYSAATRVAAPCAGVALLKMQRRLSPAGRKLFHPNPHDL
jgi:hypothetical protein